MSWNIRYANERQEFIDAMESGDRFILGEGTIRVGPHLYNLSKNDYDPRFESYGGEISFPNGHRLSLSWGPLETDEDAADGDKYAKYVTATHIDNEGNLVPHFEYNQHPPNYPTDAYIVQVQMNHEKVKHFIDHIESL